MKQLSVIIVSYNVRYYLAQCLASVERALQGIDGDVWVVDNHSKDNTVAYVRQHFPWVHVIASIHNLGFSRANNLAIRQSNGRYVLLLNPDTIVPENMLKAILQVVEEHKDAGAIGCKMLNANGNVAKESRRGIPEPMTAFYKMIGLCKRYPTHRLFGRYYLGFLPWDSVQQIEIVSGAFCLLRRSALGQVGLLDETFFMYGEDIDLSYRLLKAGYHNYYVPFSILHYKGESTQKSSFRYVHVFYEAMLIFFRKHYGHKSWLLTLPIRLAIYAKAFISLLSMQVDKARRGLGFFSPKPSRTRADYLLIDMEKYTYKEALALLAESDHKRWLALYYPRLQLVITPQDVYTEVSSVKDFEQMLEY